MGPTSAGPGLARSRRDNEGLETGRWATVSRQGGSHGVRRAMSEFRASARRLVSAWPIWRHSGLCWILSLRGLSLRDFCHC